VPQHLWSRVCRDPDLCQGPGGRFWGRCLYRKDRERAERCHVLVVNHALLLSGGRLPPYDALIIDEAHNLEETAVSRFGTSVSQGAVSRLLEDIRALSRSFAGLEEASRNCGAELASFFRGLAEAHGFSGGEDETGGKLLSEAGAFAVPDCVKRLEKEMAAFVKAETATDDELELRVLLMKVGALKADLGTILGESAEDTARWLERSGAGVELRACPLAVAGRLGEGLLAQGIPVVMTSATLSSGAGLKAFKAAVGLEDAREVQLDSPFDYASQAALLVLDELPEPSEDEGYAKAVAGVCRKIVDRVPGGVFILFSSWRMLRKVHELLRKKLKGRPLWMQGATGNEALVSHFIEAGNAVLLGVDTFWQGVDVPGDALSCVVLVKLPFPNFGSPVEEARRRWFESLGRGYFEGYSLPRAVMKFRQGFGRLIRTAADRGAVVVLDPRIRRRGYGAAFLEALPRTRKLQTIEDLEEFFGAKTP
jgi:ATP-dependent DNA helicase DinG